MALTARRLWTGTKRGDLKRMERLCLQLLKWNTRPYTVPFMTAAQVLIIQSVIANVTTPMLDATTPR